MSSARAHGRKRGYGDSVGRKDWTKRNNITPCNCSGRQAKDQRAEVSDDIVEPLASVTLNVNWRPHLNSLADHDTARYSIGNSRLCI